MYELPEAESPGRVTPEMAEDIGVSAWSMLDGCLLRSAAATPSSVPCFLD